MEKANQCTKCGILDSKNSDKCECCGNKEMIQVCLPQEDDYVFTDVEDFCIDEDFVHLD